MILYTTIPLEHVFPANETEYTNQQTIEINGGLLVVEPISQTEYKVVRLISSDPGHYLNENYCPGTIVQLKPQL